MRETELEVARGTKRLMERGKGSAVVYGAIEGITRRKTATKGEEEERVVWLAR